MSESAPAGRAPRVLIVDDDPASLDVLHGCLEEEGYTVHAARDGARALAIATRVVPDAVLLDVVMDGMNGFEVCRHLKQDARMAHTPILFITGRDRPDARLEAFRAGGVDIIAKPFEEAEVRARVRVHVELSRLRERLERKNEELEERIEEIREVNRKLREEMERRRKAEAGRDRAEERAASLARREAEQWGMPAIVGRSPAMERIREELETLRETEVSVLVSGESGTGKELVARALHLSSPRAEAPFVAVNCAAVPPELAESTFFGHLRGSFSGAHADQEGRFAAADGGTLFLDEIGAMPSELQPKLLRALEEGAITPVGASHSRSVDVRVISATNSEPAEQIEDGRLRRDLYFRLARYTVSLPALREREGDIPILAEHFLRALALEMGRPQPVLDEAVLRRLEDYPFPGNVRELRNMMEHALLRSRGGAITPEHLHFLQPAAGTVETTGDAREHTADAESAPEGESDPARRVLAYVRQHGSIRNADVRKLLGISRRQATYLLGKMVDDGHLARVGSRRWTSYREP